MTVLSLLEGLLLRLVALVIGVRVTSWIRGDVENASIGGAGGSKHLWGGAIDVGREAQAWQREVLRRFAKEIDETQGPAPGTSSTGPHLHYQVDGRAVPVVLAAAGIIAVWWGAASKHEGKAV